MKCVICGNEIEVDENGWANGHNAYPVEEGRCCSKCNFQKVLPARIKLFEGK